jgi:sterol desaturase/sphingolipid hydroxylase (fatty acid hydroxylase superfamily)
MELIPYYMMAFVMAIMLVEMLASYVLQREAYNSRDTFTNLSMYAGYVAIDLFWLPVVYGIFTFVHEHSLFKIGEGWYTFDGQTPVWAWPLLFVLDDLCYYSFHRTSHKIRLFWASHVAHHSSQRFNLSVGFRQTWLPFYAFLFWVPLAFIGFDPLMIMMMQLISLTLQGLVHTELIRSFGPFDLVFNSPSHHRVHHGTQSKYIDRNFAGVLIIWDRLFGTFQREEEKPVYGIGGEPIYNPLRAAFGEILALSRDLFRRLFSKESDHA